MDRPDCTLIIPAPRHVRSPPRIVLHLHSRCLAAKSLFLRGLLRGVEPLDLVQSLSPSPSPPRIPRTRLPRILPSPPSHPVVFLPVPDPSSIQPLFRWMYSGTTDHLELALRHGELQWHGLARNVEYLGLPTDIKVFLGRWYRSWLLPAPVSSPCLSDDESDLDSYDSYSSCSEDDEMQCDDEPDRGRSRDVKPLAQLCGQLRLCTT